MTKKVWITLLALLIGCLVAYNFVALIYPETFIMCLTDTRILTVGNFIEERTWLTEMYYYVTGFISFYLFGCISKSKWKLKFWETLVVLALSIASQLLYIYLPEIGIFAGILPMLLIGVFVGNNTKGFLITFILHRVCPFLTLFVRGYNEALPMMNIGSNICLLLESYILLFVSYIICNIKEKKNE